VDPRNGGPLPMLYGSETWPVNAKMTQLINSFATSAYQIMTGVKRLDEVRNSLVLDSVSRNDIIHAFLSRQLRFLGHQLRSDHALYALCEPTHGKTWRGRPHTNYITYIQKITEHQLSELIELAQNREDWRQLMVKCADPQPPTRRRKNKKNR